MINIQTITIILHNCALIKLNIFVNDTSCLHILSQHIQPIIN
jgi:hypothetical protein